MGFFVNLGVRLDSEPPAVQVLGKGLPIFTSLTSFPNTKMVREANISYAGEQRAYQYQRFVCFHVLTMFDLANITDFGCLTVCEENNVSLL